MPIGPRSRGRCPGCSETQWADRDNRVGTPRLCGQCPRLGLTAASIPIVLHVLEQAAVDAGLPADDIGAARTGDLAVEHHALRPAAHDPCRRASKAPGHRSMRARLFSTSAVSLHAQIEVWHLGRADHIQTAPSLPAPPLQPEQEVAFPAPVELDGPEDPAGDAIVNGQAPALVPTARLGGESSDGAPPVRANALRTTIGGGASGPEGRFGPIGWANRPSISPSGPMEARSRRTGRRRSRPSTDGSPGRSRRRTRSRGSRRSRAPGHEGRYDERHAGCLGATSAEPSGR